MQLRINHGTGNPNARIVILKNSPSFDEVRAQEFLTDGAGTEFRKMLNEAGIVSSDVYTTSVTRDVLYGHIDDVLSDQKKHRQNKVHFENDMYIRQSVLNDIPLLMKEIEAIKPTLIIPIGELAMYLCSGETSLSTWRGSVGFSQRFNCKFLPTLAPSLILKVWAWRYQSVRDLQRARHESQFSEMRVPAYNFKINPSYYQVMKTLQDLIDTANKNSH